MTRLAVLLAIVSLAGCARNGSYVAGTKVPYSPANKQVLEVAEEYRLAVERADTDALMLLAHPQYWEDSGTPSGSDDYGYEGLRNVLMTRLPLVSDIRYSLRYMSVRQSCPEELKAGCRAAVDVMIDASFTVANALGAPKRPDKRDQNELLLEYTCGNAKTGAEGGGDSGACRWLFLSGM